MGKDKREYGKEMRLGDGFTHRITLLSLILKCFHFLIIKKEKNHIVHGDIYWPNCHFFK